MTKTIVWGIRQAIMGRDKPEIIYFSTKAARDAYYEMYNYCDKLRACKADPRDMIFDSLEHYQNYRTAF